ncbi:MAG: HAMP domain-containing histidine kinase [Deltaproteobacteria bacterium]|nr:HAMP domain-containing histidine kinase [Deltaproteobacteria bacterium]
MSVLRRIRDFFARSIHWSNADKCLFAAGICGVITAGNLNYLYQVEADPGLLPFVNRDVLPVFIRTVKGLIAGWAVIAAIALAVRKTRPELFLLVYVTVIYYALANTVGAWFFGPDDNLAWVQLIGGVILAFLYFEPRPVIAGTGAGLLMITAATVSMTAGWMPYAPLMESPPVVDGRLSALWEQQRLALGLFLAMLIVGLTSALFARLRSSERALASAYDDLSKAHAELKSTQDQLVRSEALASLGSLVHGAAHELRNPLGSSFSILQMLKEDIGQSPSLAAAEKSAALQALSMSFRGQERASLIVNRMYELSDELAAVEDRAALATVMGVVQGAFPQLQIEGLKPLSGLLVPQRYLTKILLAVVDNAARSGSSIPPSLRLERIGGDLICTVSDRGRGISADLLPHVFKPFTTGEKSGEGHSVGLGLYITHVMLSRIGGSIDIRSTAGEGTIATIRIPIAD